MMVWSTADGLTTNEPDKTAVTSGFDSPIRAGGFAGYSDVRTIRKGKKMTKKEFLNAVSNGKIDIVQIFLDTISAVGTDYCVIGGLAVNAYAEPVVSLDLDIIIATKNIERVCEAASKHFKIQRFSHSINLSSSESDLRIQLQTDSRYQDFISRAKYHNVLGYDMKVADVKDVLQGKIWAYSDEERRMSKRQKDLADIIRLIESFPSLSDQIPDAIRKKFE